jgi:hypothetical protein
MQALDTLLSTYFPKQHSESHLFLEYKNHDKGSKGGREGGRGRDAPSLPANKYRVNGHSASSSPPPSSFCAVALPWDERSREIESAAITAVVLVALIGVHWSTSVPQGPIFRTFKKRGDPLNPLPGQLVLQHTHIPERTKKVVKNNPPRATHPYQGMQHNVLLRFIHCPVFATTT